MEHRGELLVGLAPHLACYMLLGWGWPPIYDTLERVWDIPLFLFAHFWQEELLAVGTLPQAWAS